jgi:hypothetical protein
VIGWGPTYLERTTPTKVNKVGAAKASRAARFARNCAAIGWPIPVRDIAASIAISGTAKASARYAAALSHHKAKAPAPTSGMRVTLAAKSVFGQGALSASR